MHTQNWVIEFRTNRSHLYRIVQTEVSTTSKYQEILIADVQGFGRALFLDGVPQSSSLDEHMYHEALIHISVQKATRSIFFLSLIYTIQLIHCFNSWAVCRSQLSFGEPRD